MVFNTNANLDAAKSLVASEGEDQLYYACLELRYALEKIAYQKLKQRLDKVAIEEIAAWQPKRALDRLMELVDEHLDQDATLSMAREKEYGVVADDAKFILVGTTKGVDPKKIGRHWQKLGSFLHIKMPQSKTDFPEKPDPAFLKSYINEVIEYIEKITSTNFDGFFSMNVTVKCSRCEQSIVRNRNLLKDRDIVQCQNPECPASYIVNIREGEFEFESNLISLECKDCSKITHFEANAFLKMPYTQSRTAKCSGCESKYHVRWGLEYAMIKPQE